MKDEALRLALEALEANLANWNAKRKAIPIIKQALKQQEPEPRPDKSWWDWYTSPPENWNEKYGDAFVWTAQEKMLMKQLKEKNHDQ